jgi:hypothetical protein
MVTTWKVIINLSGENHTFYRRDTANNALLAARRALMKSNGITYARVAHLNYEITEVRTEV